MANEKIKNLTDNDMERILNGQRGVFFVDIWAEWCGPCRQLSQLVDEIADDYSGVADICKLDADSNKNTMSRLNIRGIPTVLVIKDGKIVQTLVGMQSKSVYENAIEKAVKM